jgi:ankyrin repeat protein
MNGQKVESHNSLIEKESDIDKQFDNITRTILNARKVQIGADDEDAGRVVSRGVSISDTSSMVFELKNIDSFGRNLLHKMAYLHKSSEIFEILNTLFYKLKSEDLPPVTTQDLFGNTALILACI